MKKILILETSSTIQKLFTKALDGRDYSLQFESHGLEIFSLLNKLSPDMFLINCDIVQPRSFEIVKIIRSIESFNGIQLAMYSNSLHPKDQLLAKECGCDFFFKLDPSNILQNIEELEEIERPGKEKQKKSREEKTFDQAFLFNKTAELLSRDAFKNAILSKLLKIVDNIENIEDVVKEYLDLLVQICEVPLASVIINENDGPHGYYVCADCLEKKDIEDFLNVCSSDFEKNQAKGNALKINAKRLDSSMDLDGFYNGEIKFSSYECRAIKKKGNLLATIHIVLQGNIISEKILLLDFCLENSADLFDKALIAEKKTFFEKRIRRAFSRFVPEQIIDNLVLQADKTDEKVGVGETRSVAILFSDIRSFTNISEKNRADVLVSFLNRYFSAMVEIIKKHGGTIDKFIGDAIMAEFGTPVSYEDNCRRAVMAAYEMREALPSIEMGDLVLPEGMVFNIGIGIHYGDVIVGSIGSKDKTDYSVIGDSVNLASRLEGLTKTYGSQILVSDSVRTDAGENSFCFRYLDDVRVKGKKKAVPIYAVDRSPDEFSAEYKDSYTKGMELYKQGIWNLAKDYFNKALKAANEDKAAKLMLDRCQEFIKNPPENWDGAIAFNTK